MRINVESAWFTDERRFKLAELVGSIHLADGMMVEAWRLSQEFWAAGRKMIPAYVFSKIENYQKIFEASLAKDRNGLVYVCGSKQLHDWAVKRKEAASLGGKKGGGSNKSKKSLEKDSKQTATKEEANNNQTATKQQASYSSSISSSSSFSNSKKEKELNTSEVPKKPKADPDKSGSVVSKPWLIFKSYSDAFEARYKHKPIQNPRQMGLCKQVSARLGDLAEDVVRFYLSHNDGFYLKAQHPLSLLVRDCEGLAVQMQRGRAVTSVDVRAFERSNQYDSLIAELELQNQPKEII